MKNLPNNNQAAPKSKDLNLVAFMESMTCDEVKTRFKKCATGDRWYISFIANEEPVYMITSESLSESIEKGADLLDEDEVWSASELFVKEMQDEDNEVYYILYTSSPSISFSDFKKLVK